MGLQFFIKLHPVRIIVVRILPPGLQSRSAAFWSAFDSFNNLYFAIQAAKLTHVRIIPPPVVYNIAT